MNVEKNKENKSFYSKLLHITLPIAFQNLMLASVAAADALMLGSIDQNFMSAVSLATQVQFVENMFFFSIVAVESILGAQYWGKKDRESLNRLFCISLKLSISVSVVFWAACLFFPEYLMLLFTGEAELIETGSSYLKIAGWSYLFTGISQCYLTMMKVTDHPERTALISSCTVVINIVLNAVFIYGLLSFTSMGVQGAALATLVSRIIELIWAVLNSYRKNYIHPGIKVFFKRSGTLLKDFIVLLAPLIGACLFWGIGFTSYTAFMGHMGTDAAAANSVTAVVRDLLCCLCSGLSTAAGIMIGNELGAGNLDKGKKYGDTLLKISLIASGVITLIVFAVIPAVIKCVTLTPLADKYLLHMMIVTAVYMYGRSLNTIVINGIFASGGDTMFDLYSLGICMWCIAVPLAFAGTFIFHWPVIIVYACTCIDEVGKIPWVLHHYYRYRWVKDLTR